MQHQMIWDLALDHLRRSDPSWETTLGLWRSEVPAAKSDRELLEEYGWVVACCGLTAKAIRPRWARLGEALGGWEPERAATAPRGEVLQVLANRRKIDAIQSMASDLTRSPGQMTRLAKLPDKEALAWMSTLPFIGSQNRYHLARNLGWDVVAQRGPVVKLAGMLGTSPENLCRAISEHTSERLRVVDLVLWQWSCEIGEKELRTLAVFFGKE